MTSPRIQYFGSDNSVEVGPNLRLSGVSTGNANRNLAIISATTGFVAPFLGPVIRWTRLGNIVNVSFSTVLTGSTAAANRLTLNIPVARTSPFTNAGATAQCGGTAVCTGAAGTTAVSGRVYGNDGSATTVIIDIPLNVAGQTNLEANFSYVVE